MISTYRSEGTKPVNWILRIYALIMMAVAIALLIGGAVLVSSGGSIYYLLAGLAIGASGVLIWIGDSRGAIVYGAMLSATLAWALYEVGFDTWGLVTRLVFLFVIGIPLLWRSVRAGRTLGTSPSRFGAGSTFAAALVVAAVAGAGLNTIAPARPADPLWQKGRLASAPAVPAHPLEQSLQASPSGDWLHYGNDQGGSRFSPLAQITPDNVQKLEIAWEADVGASPEGPRSTLQVTPIKVGDSLYVCNGYNVVIALDAETGQQRWRYDMTLETPPSGKPCRGVSYYKVPGATGLCSERILATNQTPELMALDTKTGQPCPGFGVNGRVRLLDGMGDVPAGYNYVSSAVQIVRGKAVFGGAIMDGQYWGEPSGVIRAFDVVTGKLAWAFDTGRPQDHSAPPNGSVYTPSTPNSWAPPSADENLGLVYLPTGNSTPDFFAAQRRPFDDEISSSVIALDAETGALRWRFQTTHHDVWDYDVPSQPTLVDLPTPSGVRHALIQPTKRGEVFVLDRATGVPIKEVSELPAPQDGLPDERLSPTQPFSTGMPAFRGATLREADMWGLTPLDQMVCRIMFSKSRYEGPLTPVAPGHTIFDPGYSGAMNWGSVAVDTDRQLLLVNSMRVPSRVELIDRATANERGFKLFDGSTGQGSNNAPMEKTPYAASLAIAFLSPLGVPCNAPPWGRLTAVDLASGQVVWSQPFGTGRDSGPLGIRSHLPITMGVPNTGGSVATRSGLMFIGATADSNFRAFDVTTGALRWQADLPGAGMANPMTYESSASGRQFVVIAAGGRAPLKTKMSTKIVAYTLPR